MSEQTDRPKVVVVGSGNAGLNGGAFSGSWTLVPGRSSIQLKAKALWGLLPVKGVFSEVAGSAVVTAVGEVTGRLEIKSASIDTKIKKRDAHLRDDDFFASDRFPNIVFEVDQLTPEANGLAVQGRLSVRERSVPLSFPATVTDLGAGEMAFDAEVKVDRSELGLDWRARGATNMDNTLLIHAVFSRS